MLGRSIAAYGDINLRANGSRTVMACKMERGAATKGWDVYAGGTTSAALVARASKLALALLSLLLLPACTTLVSSPASPPPTTLGDLIGQNPLHIVFVHGMRAEGAEQSADLQRSIRRKLGLAHELPRPEVFTLNAGPIPPGELGRDIWHGDVRIWARSAPFLLRYVHESSLGTVIVDEVNWWPLLFPLKCRRLVVADVALTGADRDHLKLCARGSAQDEKDPYYPWVSTAELRELSSRRPRLAAAPVNAWLKRELMTWGLADATIAVGPMRRSIQFALNDAFSKSLIVQNVKALSASHSQRTLAVVAESLGSFAVLDAFQNPPTEANAGVRQVLSNTGYLVFLANQFALLELARPAATDASATAFAAGPQRLLEAWARTPPSMSMGVQPFSTPPVRQVIAYSDPSDVLTYDVPKVDGVSVYNVSVRLARRWFGLVANPARAHASHMKSTAVQRHLISASVPSQEDR